MTPVSTEAVAAGVEPVLAGPVAGGYGHLALALVVRAICVSLGSAGLLIAAAWTLLGR